MRKIPPSRENPIDNISIWISDKLCPLFKSLHFTANGITTLSLIFGVLAMYFLWNYKWAYFAICYYISYIFDCMDGHYARKYNMVSKFGDVYDHAKDVIVVIGIIVILFIKYKEKPKVWIIFAIVISIFSILMCAHFGCQEKLYPKSESDTLNFCKALCPGNATKNIQVSKWFGLGTWVIVFLFSVKYLVDNRI